MSVMPYRSRKELADAANAIEASTKTGGNGIDPPDGKSDDLPMKERLAKIEGLLDGMRVVIPLILGVVGILVTVMIFALNNASGQLQATNAKVDAIPGLLRDEFRAMRADMAAQTSAIANSVTAARGTPTQVIMVPATQPEALHHK